MAILELRNVDAAYGPTQVLKALNLAVEKGGIATLLGANGTGKTTILRAICNMMAMFSTYIAWALIDTGFPYWAAFGLTLLFSFLAGVTIERIIIRPVERGPALTIVIVFVGLLLILNSLAGWIFSYTIKNFPSPFPPTAWYGSKYLSPHEMGMIAVTLVVLIVVFLFFRFTPLGLAMRAAAQNPVSIRLVGIRVGWMLAFGWGLATAIGGVAGMMAAPIVYLDPDMMSGILLYGFAAALLGGIRQSQAGYQSTRLGASDAAAGDQSEYQPDQLSSDPANAARKV